MLRCGHVVRTCRELRDVLQDREKIKRDYHDQLEAEKAELLRETNESLEFTTKRTMTENEMMTAELQ